MFSSTSILPLAFALGVTAIPIIPLNVSPGIDLKGGPGRFSQSGETNDFSIKSVPNPVYKPNGKTALTKVLAKYGLEIPESLQKLRRRADGSVAANPGEFDTEYVCPVTIGGSQKLNLNFDTGSADFWVFSSFLPKSVQQGHEVYTPGSTSKPMNNYTWHIGYGDGSSASGTVVKDTVAIGKTVVEEQAMGIAKNISDSFQQDTFSDGLVGLAFGSINTIKPVQQKTFFENAMQGLTAGVLTADLRHKEAGSYDFGTIDQKKYTGDIQYTPVDSSHGFWQFPASVYTVNNKTSVEEGATAIADTGTTLLLMSNKIAKDYYATVEGAKKDEKEGGYVFPCGAHLPDITISVGTNKAIIPGSWMNFAPSDGNPKMCFGSIQGYEGNMYIYGDIFFKAFFSVFDYDNKRFGFAAKSG